MTDSVQDLHRAAGWAEESAEFYQKLADEWRLKGIEYRSRAQFQKKYEGAFGAEEPLKNRLMAGIPESAWERDTRPDLKPEAGATE